MESSPGGINKNFLSKLKSNYVLIGRARVRVWHAWLFFGVLIGLVVGIGLVIQRGKFENSKASSAYGPQASITCPSGAVNISTSQNISSTIDSSPTNTTFCILAGIHYVSSPINPKAGQKLIGQFGAILDASQIVRQTWDVTSNSIIRSWNCGTTDCSGVVIQNLVLRNFPDYSCIGVYGPTSGNLTIDHNEIHHCLNAVDVGARYPAHVTNVRITNNYIHDNIGDTNNVDPQYRGGGYGGQSIDGGLIENNEFANNGQNQKIVSSNNVTFRNNYVHNNVSDGIWYDADNTGMVIEGNTIEDQGREGIFLEISGGGTVFNNTIRRSGGHGIFISTSRDVNIYNNTLEDNARGISYFLNCDAVGYPYPGSLEQDLRNNNSHDNIVKVGTQSGVWANELAYLGSCTSTQLGPYTSGSKNLVFQNNHYYTPNTTGNWFYSWNVIKTFSQWQAMGNDTTGTINLSSSYAGGGGGGCNSNPDNCAPAISISNPPESATVLGITTIVANASDNVSVVGVQFKVDGANVGSEVLSSPYSVNWNTCGSSNGNHVLAATARDAAGNQSTSTALTVNVSNSAVCTSPTPTSTPTPTPTLSPTSTPMPTLTPTPTPTPIDLIAPVVNSFDVQPRTRSSANRSVSWKVTDSGGVYLSKVEVKVAIFNSSLCSDTNKTGCVWTTLKTATAPNQVNSWTSTTSVSQPKGTYWYGLQPIDNSGNRGYETVQIKVVR